MLSGTALALIGALAVWGYVLFARAVRAAATDAPVITVAGRQRMLTQVLTNLALDIQVAAERHQFAFLNGELRSALEAWTHAHEALQHGDAELGLPPNGSAAVAAEFAAIEPHYETISDAAERLLRATTATSVEAVYDEISKDVLRIATRSPATTPSSGARCWASSSRWRRSSSRASTARSRPATAPASPRRRIR